VLVVGMSGTGKTTAARRVATVLGLPFYEMDALAIGPRWSLAPDLVDQVGRITAEPAWIFDSWGYPAVRDMMWRSADTILWLDYPARVVLPRLIWRSAVRTATRTDVFGGNRERWRDWLSPQHPVWSAAATFAERREYLLDRTSGSVHCQTTRFTSPREFEQWYRLLRDRARQKTWGTSPDQAVLR
jgi:adenylate kinase family enzyme